jgi:diguanylate cyclase (GGDEF)-like protein/PAS domain S-box-containing protein
VVNYRTHVFVFCALCLAIATGAQGFVQKSLEDIRFRLFARQATGDVVVVTIDARSIAAIGAWPWSRQLHATAARNLHKAGAKNIAFDVDFSALSNSAADAAFSDALREAGGSVILPFFSQAAGHDARKGDVVTNRPIDSLAAHSWPAVVNVHAAEDGSVRSYGYGETITGEFVPSMAALLAGAYEPKQTPFLIDYSINGGSIPSISYNDILHAVPAALAQVRNKSVLIGGTAIELGDRFVVPGGRIIPGVKLQALAAESILQGRALRHVSALVPVAITGLLLLGAMLVWKSTRPGTRVMALLAFALVLEAIAVAVQLTYPIVADFSLVYVAIVALLIAIALEEIDIRGLLGTIADKKFRHIAMSLGDGLVCADASGKITLWNPGAAAIFGRSEVDMLGQGVDTLFKDSQRKHNPFSILNLSRDALQSSGGIVDELFAVRKSGELFPAEACFSGWQGTDGFQFGVLIRDVSARKAEEDRIRYLAEHDTLTGLANRNTLSTRMREAIAGASERGQNVALLIIGLDGFQQINDMLGHEYGDQLLVAVSERLRVLAGAGHLIARLTGDEFAIVVDGDDAASSAEQLAVRLTWSFKNTGISLRSRSQIVGMTVGGAIYPEDGVNADELLANSHLALCRAKSVQRGGHLFFEKDIRDKLQARFALEAELASAFKKGEFELFYQPQIGLAENRLVGVEALIRWRHPERGLISPGAFMPVVNTSPLSNEIANWVLNEACRQGRRWQNRGFNLRVAVNLSPSQLLSNGLVAEAEQAIAASGFSPSLLELEVTEDILLNNDEMVSTTFSKLQELGIRISFDDFGTGYGSLSYLKKFPLDKLKIDRSFVSELLSNADDAAIVRSTIDLCEQLGLSVTAEGIEDGATAAELVKMGCGEGQGYYFSKPLPVGEFEQKFLSADTTAAKTESRPHAPLAAHVRCA